MKDFTLKAYKSLLVTIQQQGYTFVTFEQYCTQHPTEKFVILRHDVDLRPHQSLAIARIENELNIRATYYFRIVPESNQPQYITAIARLGHEIGYHYEDLSMAGGNATLAFEKYEANLRHFRQFYPVKTTSMHGSPREKIDNRDVWKSYNYRSFDIIGEPYFDFLNRNDVLYFTDTGGMWDGDRYNVRDRAVTQSADSIQANLPHIHSTVDLMAWFTSSANQYPIMINTHPQRWTDNMVQWWKEKIAQTLKNQVKAMIKK